jgi:hypothetical protein
METLKAESKKVESYFKAGKQKVVFMAGNFLALIYPYLACVGRLVGPTWVATSSCHIITCATSSLKKQTCPTTLEFILFGRRIGQGVRMCCQITDMRGL